MSKDRNKLYIVWEGRTPGVYDTWEECSRKTHGVKSRLKSFEGITREEAERILVEGMESASTQWMVESNTPKKDQRESKSNATRYYGVIPPGSWAVDAATSHNPGPMEYRCVDIDSGRVVFASKVYPLGTNNIGEFLAIVHAMALMTQNGEKHVIYSDSRTALSWVRQRMPKTTLPEQPETKELFDVLHRAVTFLQNAHLSDFELRKWQTDKLGEIPADYGRK